VTRLLMLVEGQSERAFVNTTLKKHLEGRGVYAEPTILLTSSSPSGAGHRGGVGNWEQIHGHLRKLMGSTGAWVTTMLDFYGLPRDFPGRDKILDTNDAYKNVEMLENSFARAVCHERGHKHFIPFISLFELEAWVFSSPEVVAKHFDCRSLTEKLRAVVREAGSPELINGGKDTHPKTRLIHMLKGQSILYKPRVDGQAILQKIGIPAIRAACPHFNAWLTRLESLGARTD